MKQADSNDLAREIKDAFIEPPVTFDAVASQKWVDHAMKTMVAGYAHYAYTLARCLLIISSNDPRTVECYVRTAAAFSSRSAAQEAQIILVYAQDIQGQCKQAVTRIEQFDNGSLTITGL